MKACATQSSLRTLVKFFSPTQWGAPMMPQRVKAMAMPKKIGATLKSRKGKVKKETKR